ncbi:MAG: helix-turn-helix domain-containing protein [Desulfobulbus sp.]
MSNRITKLDVMQFKQELLGQVLLITPDEAAKTLDCSEHEVMNLVREGRLPSYNLNKRARDVRLMASELRDYINSIEMDRDY